MLTPSFLIGHLSDLKLNLTKHHDLQLSGKYLQAIILSRIERKFLKSSKSRHLLSNWGSNEKRLAIIISGKSLVRWINYVISITVIRVP